MSRELISALKPKDFYITPRHIVRSIERTLGLRFSYDVCASNYQTAVTRDSRYWDEMWDSLSFWWYKRLTTGSVVFMNPPYSQLPIWTRKAEAESRRGLIVVGLIPDMRSSKWFQKNVENQASIVYLPDGRINFEPTQAMLDDPDFKQSSNPWPSCVPVWTPFRTGTTVYARFNRNGHKA